MPLGHFDEAGAIPLSTGASSPLPVNGLGLDDSQTPLRAGGLRDAQTAYSRTGHPQTV